MSALGIAFSICGLSYLTGYAAHHGFNSGAATIVARACAVVFLGSLVACIVLVGMRL